MRSVRIVCALAAVLACAAPAAADVTLKRKMEIKSPMGAMSGTSVQFVKGTKMRDDTTMGGGEMSSIIDAGTQQMIALNHKTREAEIFDMATLSAQVAKKVPPGEIDAKMTPTGETRQIAGISCTVHTMDVAAPMDIGGQTMTLRMTGPVCVAKDGPGQADVTAFYKAVVDKGLFFGDVRQAQAQPGQARGLAAMYREMADLGVPLAQDMTMTFEGGGAMAGMMSKMGGSTMSSEVLSVTTDPVPDSTFEIPEGYKVVKR